MPFKIGDHVFYRCDFTKLDGWREGVVTRERADKLHGQLLWTDGAHKGEDCLIAAFAWPTEVKDEIIAIVTENMRLQKELDDRMGLVYKLRNRLINEGKL